MAARLVAGFDPDMSGSGLVVASLMQIRWATVAISEEFPRGLPAVKGMVTAVNREITRMLDECPPDEVVIECPIDYENQRVARPNDLIVLGMVSAAVACRMDQEKIPYVLVYAREWKGAQRKGVNQHLTLEHYQVPHRKPPAKSKAPCHLKANAPEIFGTLPAAYHSELFDALGMAKWRLEGGDKARWSHR